MHLARLCHQMQFSAACLTLSVLFLVSNLDSILLLKRLALFCHVQQSGLRLPYYRLWLRVYVLHSTLLFRFRVGESRQHGVVVLAAGIS